jgi:hypothetical protein
LSCFAPPLTHIVLLVLFWMTSYHLFDVIAFGLLACIVRAYIASRTPRRYPPGPRGLPLLGNLFDIPQSSPWETYTRWGKQYGKRAQFLNEFGLNVVLRR